MTSYGEALISQQCKMVEEKKLLEQERARVLQEKGQPLRSAYLSCLDKEEDWPTESQASAERVRGRSHRKTEHLLQDGGWPDIFKHDTYCGDVWNTNKRHNGRLMWLYLRYWELMVELKKFKNVERAILEQ
ncbi:hypothetical protein J1605_007707 [Eschrichtius robustus]|uniref:Coiled-coil domain-containing protein n=1 Tax=Eschrichtius robustus TaxID=9764 RepID=A0AB34H253_ESCRO|nr:hypothetical protein J1605_007707 [Eschrichtius robustus]